MSAAASPVATQLFREGTRYWEELLEECRRQTDSMNAWVSGHGFLTDELIQCAPGAQMHMVKSSHPSTSVKVGICFEPWGPVISGSITGRQDDEMNFAPKEFEILLAKDLDGATVAILEEGRSLSPPELATYLTQNFRRCFQGVSLPCRDANA
ncbi:MAG: hypothetical protein WB992_23980 [Bryobacteraceae bacterium]